MTLITVYGRTGCHLCEDALQLLQSMQQELKFELEEILIDGNEELEKMYGEKIPVTLIDGKHHDFWRVDPDRFRSSLETHRRHQ
jgi:glutaredoxin